MTGFSAKQDIGSPGIGWISSPCLHPSAASQECQEDPNPAAKSDRFNRFLIYSTSYLIYKKQHYFHFLYTHVAPQWEIPELRLPALPATKLESSPILALRIGGVGSTPTPSKCSFHQCFSMYPKNSTQLLHIPTRFPTNGA